MKKPWYKKWWIWVLMGLATLITICGAFSEETPTEPTEQITVETTIATEPTIDVGFVPSPEPTEALTEPTNVVAPQPVVEEIDNRLCKILSAEMGGINYEGKPTIVITYEYTNNNLETKSFNFAFDDLVFQNGIECEPNYLYDGDNSSKEVRSGATLLVQKSYILNDTVSNVEVEITAGFLIYDNTVITKTFTIIE